MKYSNDKRITLITKSTNIFDFCILGAGIAGLSLADALHEKGYSVTVIEKYKVASGASGTPGGLVNPATGRRATKTWKAEACYRTIRDNLQKVAAFTSEPFYQNNGLLRPALTEKMVKKMRKQYEKTHWPEGWCQWQNREQIIKRHPGINCVGGGLWLPIGLTVDVGAYLKAYAKYLSSNDILVHSKADAHIKQDKSSWLIHFSDQMIKAEQLVFATGFATARHPYWDFLPLNGVKGQVAKFRANKKLLSFSHSISSLGYIARLGKQDEFIQGSTYEHDFDDIEPDPEGEVYLRKRMARTLPQLAEQAELIEQWAGVRLTTPNKKPVLGRHPEIKNLHVFSALGSKGLMHGKFLADHYADHLKNSTLLYKKVTIDRFER